MNINQTKSDNLDAVTASTGAVVTADRMGTAKGCTLANGTTYFFVLDKSGSPVDSVHLQWAAAVAATFTVEASCYPKLVGGNPMAPADVTDFSTTTGEWIQLNPSTAYVPVVGTGNSVTSLTITAGGTNAGAAWIDLGNLGARRVRIKVVVTTGGVVRCGVNGRA